MYSILRELTSRATINRDTKRERLYFACRIPDGYRPASGSHPDKHQVDVVWLPVDQLAEHTLFPQVLSHRLQQIICTGPQGYLGEIG